ncbi:putative holin [Ralstonia pseudosolanacearum]|uniref:putative holin n=1 Tax=Ralstonia pseudosolanacearum TaxID=1310165 RepID=UPI0026767F5B|nr:putative holin [Ralstonia pseudosolanacearum]MDO3521841.1 putative holin [Ralstonia pseudosolanacearum]MDO3547871.1 putative holin [Ralstonia pseudosolanacearum]MDO3551185.1 putative holin [Ralstonia pseudosolanacearum]MDO3566220.1 putative holin [Ralstonia pseudosolanacearum]MDO3580906.1 putative holin [Ralstonia pseudosolanacearum]
MAEPIATSTSAAAVAVTSVGAVSLLPGVDPGTVLGAFAGAAVFALNSGELTVAKKLSFLLLSIVAGVLSAPLAACLIARALPANTEVSEAVGALVASTVMVRLLLALIRAADNSDKLLAALRGGSSDNRGGNQP